MFVVYFVHSIITFIHISDTGTGYSCYYNNPCTPHPQSLPVPYQFYYDHKVKGYYVQCDEFGGCFDKPCPRNQAWNPAKNTCTY